MIKKIGIYKITSPSNKIYIGQSINIERRFNQYQSLSKSSIGPKLYNSLKKYGPKNHTFEIIEECKIKELNNKEIFYKLKYNSVNEGLNCELYDTVGIKSLETKNKQSKSQKQNLYNPNILKKRVKNCKKASTLLSSKKRKRNTNWVERNKKLNKPRKRYKKFQKFSLTGILIEEYNNINNILKEFNNPRPQNLYTCLRGEYNTWMGFKWKGVY